MFKDWPFGVPIEVCLLSPPHSPTEFWVVSREDEKKVEKLRRELREHYVGSSESPSGVEVGEAYVFKDDRGVWRRGRVEFVGGVDEADVRDVDTGLLLRRRSGPFFDLATKFQTGFMGMKCRLNGVVWKDGLSRWSERDLENFEEVMTPRSVNVVGVSSGFHVVDVALNDDRDLAAVLVETGIADGLDLEQSLQSLQTLVTKNCLSRFETVEELKMPKMPTESAAQSMDEGESYWISINSVVTPDQFWASLLDDPASDLERLESDMKDHYSRLGGMKFKANVRGNMYAAKCHSGSLWKRASILEMKLGKASIFYCDYGHTSTISLAHLSPLDPKFVSFPVQAVCCSLGLSSRWQKQTAEYFRRLVSKAIFSIRVVERQQDRVVVDFVCEDSIKSSLLSFMKTTEADFEKSIGAPDRRGRGVAVERDTPPAKRDTSTAKRDISPAKRDTSTAKRDTPPAKRDISPAKRDVSPAKRDTSPAKKSPRKYPSSKKKLTKGDAVVLSSISSSSDFHVLQVNGGDQHKFQQLMSELRDHCSTAAACDPQTTTSPGSLVACHFNNIWCRASVVDCTGDRAELFLVDFGNTVVRKKNKLKQMPGRLIDLLPVQSLHCALNLTGRPDVGEFDAWFKDNCEGLVYLVESAEEANGKHFVDIRAEDENRSVCQKILNDDSTEVERPSRKRESGADVVVEKDRESDPKLEEGCSVTVVHINSPTDFYVQVKDDAGVKILEDVTFCLNRSPLPPRKVVEAGELVAAEFEGVWYRAVVMEIARDDFAKVAFVDYGNVETVAKDSIRGCRDVTFGKSPFLAKHCSLNAPATNNGTKLTNKFKEVCLEKAFVVKNLSRDSSGKFCLDLTDQSGRSAVDLDRHQEEATSRKAAIPPAAEIDKEDKRCRVQNPNHPPEPVDGDLLPKCQPPLVIGSMVTITYSNSPFDFYINTCDEDLSRLTNSLDEYCSKFSEAPPELAKDDFVAATFDGVWCRARVLDVKPNGMLKLHFTDYGNVAEADEKTVRRIPKKMKDANPKPAVHCWLVLNKSDSLIGHRSDASNWFRQNCEWKTYELASIQDSGVADNEGGKIFDVELLTTNGEGSLLDVLLRSNVFSEASAKSPDARSGGRVFLEDLEIRNGKKTLRCNLLFSISPGRFWCQDLDSVVAMNAEKMAPPPSTNIYRPEVGEVCIVFLSDYAEWYRAKVIEVTSSGASVHLIDNEEDADVPFTHILPLPLHLKKYPPLAFLCSLHGVSPASSSWSEKANEYFLTLASDQIVEVTIVKCDGPLHWVRLVNAKLESVAEKLKSFKLSK